MDLRGNITKQVAACSLVALPRRPRAFASAQKVPHSLHQQLFRPVLSGNDVTKSLRINAFSPEAKAEEIAEEAAHSVPHLKPDERVLPWDDDRGGVQNWFQRALKDWTKKAWIAALALFYLYQEAAAKLPWVKIKRFEKWFWTTCRCRWVHAMNAASVLGGKWWRDTTKNMSWRSTKAHLAQKRAEMEGEMQENVEHVKHDIEESVEQQKDTVNRKVPARVNPLLIKENLDQRMQSAMEASGLGNHVDAAMDKLRDAVPMLKSSDKLSKAEAAAEAKAAAEAEAAEQHANASASAATPGIVTLPMHTEIILPAIGAAAEASSAGMRSFSKHSAAERGTEQSKQAKPRVSKSFLPFFGGRKDAKKSDPPAKQQPEEVDSSGRRWPQSMLFWK